MPKQTVTESDEIPYFVTIPNVSVVTHTNLTVMLFLIR
jgi:hypothetical protein